MQKVRSLLLAIFLISTSSNFIYGCGGGTVGTGGREYSGTVLDKLLQPLENVVVSIPETSIQDVTNADGEFSFQSDSFNDKENFAIKVQEKELETTVADLAKEKSVEVLFIVDSENNTVEGMTVKKSSDDSEDPELPEEEEFFHDEKISINAGLNKDATFVSLPGSFNTFSQINSLSQFSIFVNSKVIVYFFALDESTWEFRAYADGGDVKNKVAGTPYLLVSGKLKFSDTGEFPNAKSAQSAEVMWRGSNITSVITFNVTTILREGSSSADSTSTFE